jgi:signal transduction histidine kinase
MSSSDRSFQDAACGLLVTSADGMIRRANARFCAQVGWSEEALVNQRRVQELFSAGGKIFHQTYWVPMLQMHGSLAEVKLEVVTKEGGSVPMLFNAARTHADGDTWDDIAAMVVNDRQSYEKALLEARRAAEAAQEQLTRLDKQKDRFLATMSHELRNPLAPIMNVVEILKRQNLDDPTVRWARTILRNQVSHMAHLVDDLLDASRITQGKIRLQVEPVVLADALTVAIQAARPLIDRARHALEVRLPDATTQVMADPTRLTQMLNNLLTNAAKYTPDGGRITVAVSTASDTATIAVRDSGIGMTADDIDHVFEMFSQVESASDRSEGGLGIGLALVKSLAEMHGGTIMVTSAGPGHGSEFSLTIPLADDGATNVSQPTATGLATRS